MSIAPVWSVPPTASAAAIPTAPGISAARVTHTDVPTISTTLRVRNSPGQVRNP
ncbi:hypothetical protein SAMN05444521_5041 [Streptomyces sp. 3214.6]|nr:hypothetical protein SAMN05444521_5041 [Streptomyces sp. 3214.6]